MNIRNLAVKVGGALTATSLLTAQAHANEILSGAGNAQGDLSSTPLQDQIKNVTNTLLLVIGIVAVIMLIIGGFRYIFSQGNEKSVTDAKNTILFAVIGIVVAMLAYAIVNFVVGRFGGN